MTYSTDDMGRRTSRIGVSHARATQRPHAFTIIEMLVVLVIIGILAGIVITLAHRVSHSGKYAASRNVLQIAENMLTEYVSARETTPPMFVKSNQTRVHTTPLLNPLDPDPISPDTYLFPIVDGRFEGRTFTSGPGGGSPRFDKDLDPVQPSAALLLLAMRADSPIVERDLKAVDERFLELRNVYAYGWRVNATTGDPSGALVLRRLRIPVLVDAFGNLIRYVHPGFQGGSGDYWNNATPSMGNHRASMDVVYQPVGGPALTARFTRSYRPFLADTAPPDAVGDADEGLAIGGHGYFYSPGKDEDPGTRLDNVYTKQPPFPAETVKLN